MIFAILEMIGSSGVVYWLSISLTNEAKCAKKNGVGPPPTRLRVVLLTKSALPDYQNQQ